MNVVVGPPPSIYPGMAFHIDVPAPRQAGDRVEALYGDNFAPIYYPATIDSILDGGTTCRVTWDDGDSRHRVMPVANVRQHPAAPPHQQRQQLQRQRSTPRVEPDDISRALAVIIVGDLAPMGFRWVSVAR